MVERLIPIVSDLRAGGERGRKAKRNVKISLIIFILSIMITFNFYGIVLNWLNESKNLRIPLCDYETSIENIERWEEYNGNVPDYNAEITLNILLENLFRNSKLEFNLNIVDTGITRLEKPYFYIFLINPDEEIVAMFPHLYYSSFIEPSCDNYKPQISQHVGTDERKWKPWIYHDYSKETFFVPSEIKDKGYELTREELMGYGEYNIIFTYPKLEKEGEWRIKIVLFDEEYESRQHNYLKEEDEDNAVKVETVKFNVIYGGFIEEDSLYVSVLGTVLTLLGLFFITPYYILKYLGDNIERNLRENFWGYLIIIIMILLSIAISKYL